MSFYNTLKKDINAILNKDILKKVYKKEVLNMFQVSEPPKDKFGDVSTNAALVLSKFLKISPNNFADLLIKELKKIKYIEDAKVEGPGFINLSLKKDFWLSELKEVLLKNDKYGESNIGKSEKVIIEFVSANPTGPLHIGHCRGAVYGDVLSNIMKKLGYKVFKEYYINDTGSQIDKLTNSVIYRYNELFNKNKKNIDENLYPGEYLINLAQDLKKKYGSKLLEKNKKNNLTIKDFSLKWILNLIKNDLNLLGVNFDLFYSENNLIKKNKISICLDTLKKNKLIYEGIPEKPKGGDLDEWEPRKQSLFKSTNFGDDADRALQKSDGDYTYFAKDIAYHWDKYKRGFSFMINVWGADHGGYIKRLSSAVKAITNNKVNIIIKTCQLVRVIDKKKALKMSKREGKFISLKKVLDNVGKDVTRFIMLLRKNNEDIDFDLEKITEESKDNPVFYVQYAHARCCSVLREAKNYFNPKEISLNEIKKNDLKNLNDKNEILLIKEVVKWPKIIEDSVHYHEPHRITFFLQSLSSKFHSFWNYGKMDPSKRFINIDNKSLTLSRLSLIYAVRIILSNGLNLLGVKPLNIMK
ncbi:MAG: arginine--tRNA ligase [Alphaproteobacteria bacterium]|nr:arginine--tRNA ligase [Alphaproteobacteria bacterium]